MKLYYICPEERTKDIHAPWHGLHIGDGMMMVCVSWRDEGNELLFTHNQDVHCLPHPVFESDHPVHEVHIGHLRRAFPGIEHGHNIHDVIREAVKVHPVFRLRIL